LEHAIHDAGRTVPARFDDVCVCAQRYCIRAGLGVIGQKLLMLASDAGTLRIK